MQETDNMQFKRPSETGHLPPKKKMKIEDGVEFTEPTEFVVEVFKQNGFSEDYVRSNANSKFVTPTPEMVQAYTMEATKAVRDNDLDKLRELHDSGVVLECCNRFGDSLVHIACRRGHTRMVKFLVEEVKASVHFVDDLKRTPLHDACWTAEPNFEIVDLLLRVAPELILCADKRGDTPFNYARKIHWKQWARFLSERRSLLRLKKSVPSDNPPTRNID
jgi:ankyrin repeat protein